MEARLVRAALLRKRGTVAIAVIAVAIGGSVASALLNVSGDVSNKVTHELRALGPNLLVVPAERAMDAGTPWAVPATYLDEARARARLSAAGLEGVPILYAVARVGGQTVVLAGADLEGARRLHPGWSVAAGEHPTLMGARLMRRLAARPGDTLMIELASGRTVRAVVGARLETGTPDDEAWWIPLGSVQSWTGLEGHASLFQARIEGGAETLVEVERAIERGGEMRVLALRALTATEAGLLERMKRLMALVTVASLLAAFLCALGTLTDLALERRREIALMKALGAGAADVVRQFTVEAIAIGLIGGTIGWGFGLVMAQVIGHEVFRSAIAVRWDVPPLVIALSLAVAILASLGPMRLALGVQPAVALKGE